MEQSEKVDINGKDVAVIGKVMGVAFLIKHGIFAFACFAAAVFLFIESQNVDEDQTMLLFMSLSFFIVSIVLVSRMFSQTKFYQALSSFSEHINFRLILSIVFIGIAALMVRYFIKSGFSSGMHIFFAVVFAFIGAKSIIRDVK